jgi:hypothetical protein
MSYLERLKAEFSENPRPKEPQKLQEAPFCSFDSAEGRYFPESEAAIAAPAMTDQAADIRGARTPLSPTALVELPPEDATYPWWRVSIVGPRALNIELEMRSAWTVSDWGGFARRHYGPDATVVVRACPEPEPVTEEGAAEDLRVNLSGVSPEFAARLSAEDLADIAAGDIPLGTVQAFEAAAIAREVDDLEEFFEERNAILEHDAGLRRANAEAEAARIVATYARNRGYLWASLRAALSGDTPFCPLRRPTRPARWTPCPLGVATVAVLKDKRVVGRGRSPGRKR